MFRAARRRFVNWLLATSGTFVTGSVLYPVVRYLVPPENVEPPATRTELPFGPDEVPENSGRIFRIGKEPGILVRTPSGDLRAFSAVCTHLGCIVQYRDDLSHIWCACHNGHYDLHGINIQGPPPRPLPEFDVNVSGDRIVVSRTA